MPYTSWAFKRSHAGHSHPRHHPGGHSHHHQKRHGLTHLFAYTNHDGTWTEKNCGQAAAATALRSRHLFAEADMKGLEERFPPDVVGGLCGTGKGRVLEILKAYHCPHRQIEGKRALVQALSHHQPVLVMLSLPGRVASGHWMVAYACDEHHVHLTNYQKHHDRMTWSDFEEAWDSWLSFFIDMDNTGIAIG